jgi:PAS domain-containing protein
MAPETLIGGAGLSEQGLPKRTSIFLRCQPIRDMRGKRGMNQRFDPSIQRAALILAGGLCLLLGIRVVIGWVFRSPGLERALGHSTAPRLPPQASPAAFCWAFWSVLVLISRRQANALQSANRKLAEEIYDRERAEEKLLANEEEFRTAFEMAPYGMYVSAPDGRLLLVNRAFCELAGPLRGRAAHPALVRTDASGRSGRFAGGQGSTAVRPDFPNGARQALSGARGQGDHGTGESLAAAR